MKIPRQFTLFSTQISIFFDDYYNNSRNQYGESDYSQSIIRLSTKHQDKDLSEGKIMDTFYHEKVHMILDTMKRHELSNDETFVDIFAKLLRQSDETAIYEDNTPYAKTNRS